MFDFVYIFTVFIFWKVCIGIYTLYILIFKFKAYGEAKVTEKSKFKILHEETPRTCNNKLTIKNSQLSSD